MAKLVIFGTGVVARLASFYFRTDSEHDVVAFAVDPEFKQGDTFEGGPVVSTADVATRYPPAEYEMFVALGYSGMNTIRARKYAEMKAAGYRLASYVSSRCTYLAEALPGDNCFILEDNTIQPFVTIGSNVTLWSGNHVGHDAVIGDHCFISSHVVISGFVRVGAYSFLGVNATIRDAIEIAPSTLVGAGSIIMKNTRENSVYVPERTPVFKKRSDELEI
jgi:sugar O-acyltransferase (sialic acid O-acetyltransferase NeuD family)